MPLRFVTLPVELPQQGNLLHHFDFGDVATLWQNDSQTTPVAANGDPIGSVENKGSNGTDLDQSSAASKPIYDDVAHPTSTARLDRALTQHVDAIVASGLAAGDHTVGLIFEPHNTSAQGDVFFWGLIQDRYTLNATNFFAVTHTSIGILTSSAIPPVSTMVAVWGSDTGASAEVRLSWEDGTATSGTGAGPADGGTMSIGTFNGGGSPFDGRIAEVLVWTPSLTGAERTQFEQYVSGKYGVAWT